MNKAVYGGIVATIIIFSGSFMVGHLSSLEAFDLLRSMLPSTRFLCSAVITSTSTILALILTLITFSARIEKKIKSKHYEKIRRIALFSTIAFIGSVVLLLIINLPLEDVPEEIKVWFTYLFYGILVYVAILGGMLITVMLMLYGAAMDTLLIIHPDKGTNLLINEENKETTS